MSPPTLALVVAVVILAVGLWLGLRIARWLRSRRAQRWSREGLAGERVAVRMLERAGFDVVELQAAGTARVLSDGEEHVFDVRPDAIVVRGRARFVAEFKTGDAARLGNRNTRRQLLEYAVAYPGHRLLLVDATRATIQEIEFPQL